MHSNELYPAVPDLIVQGNIYKFMIAIPSALYPKNVRFFQITLYLRAVRSLVDCDYCFCFRHSNL